MLRTLPVAAAVGVGLVAKGDSESKGAVHLDHEEDPHRKWPERRQRDQDWMEPLNLFEEKRAFQEKQVNRIRKLPRSPGM